MSEEKKIDKPQISPERMDVFTWHDGEIKFLSAKDFERIKRSAGFIDYGVEEKGESADD